MGSRVKRSMKTLLVSLALLAFCSDVSATDREVVSRPFQLCAKPLPGVAYHLNAGIDAVTGVAVKGRSSVRIMIGMHPDVPPAMKIKPALTERMPDDITLLGESANRDGQGKVKLYGFGTQLVKIGPDTVQDQTLVMISSNNERDSIGLLESVGTALYRCQ